MAKRFIRQCPHCKSKKGFIASYDLKGTHDIILDYKGKILDERRNGVDDLQNWAECIDCGKTIEVEKLDIKT